MGRNIVFPNVAKSLRRNPAVIAVASAASVLMRQISIKPHNTRLRPGELQLRNRCSGHHSVHCQIFRERGQGTMPTIVIAGFVPDATEVVEFQRDLFRSYGDIYYLNYPRTGFSSEMFSAQLTDLIAEINSRGEKPVLFGISFGCGLLEHFLRQDCSRKPAIMGIVLVSPVFCTADLVRPNGDRKGGVRILESNLRRILKAENGNAVDVDRQVERARRCFRSLFENGAGNRALTTRHLSIRRKIMAVLETTTTQGACERIATLNGFPEPDPSRPMFSGPALTLLAESEDTMLVPTSPTLALLRKREHHRSLFPQGTSRLVESNDPEDAVAHASLIFHHRFYNPLLKEWYDQSCEQQLDAAI